MKKLLIILMIFAVFTPTVLGDYQDPLLEIVKGNVPGHSFTAIQGIDENVATTQYVIWGEEAIYVFPPAATLMNVSSSDIDDDDGDTGAWNVTIFGLDGNFVEVIETVTMNGQTPVTTVNQFYRINRMRVGHSGTTETNEGIIYIGVGITVAGEPATIYNEIVDGVGVSTTAIYTVPDGYTAYLKLFAIGTDTSKIIELTLESRSIDSPDNSWSWDYHDHFDARTIVYDMPLAFPYPEHEDLKFTAENSVGSAFTTVNAFFILVEDGYTLINQTFTVQGDIPADPIPVTIIGDVVSTEFIAFIFIAFTTLYIAWITEDNKNAGFWYAFSVVWWIVTMSQWSIDQAGDPEWYSIWVFLVPLTFCIVQFLNKSFFSYDDVEKIIRKEHKPI